MAQESTCIFTIKSLYEYTESVIKFWNIFKFYWYSDVCHDYISKIWKQSETVCTSYKIFTADYILNKVTNIISVKDGLTEYRWHSFTKYFVARTYIFRFVSSITYGGIILVLMKFRENVSYNTHVKFIKCFYSRLNIFLSYFRSLRDTIVQKRKKEERKSARFWLKKVNRFKQCEHLQKPTLDKK